MERLYGHICRKSCYLCLKHYGNQRWHAFFDKDLVRDLLFTLSGQEPTEPQPVEPGQGLRLLERMLADRQQDRDPAVRRYPKGAIEEPLWRALADIGGLPLPIRDYEIRSAEDQLITVPDFTWPDAKVAVFCDGFAYHGNPHTLELDAHKRNYLQAQGWVVLTYWGRTILKDAAACARQIRQVYLDSLLRRQ
jgi:very-short-patch-repair endonuclease